MTESAPVQSTLITAPNETNTIIPDGNELALKHLLAVLKAFSTDSTNHFA